MRETASLAQDYLIPGAAQLQVNEPLHLPWKRHVNELDHLSARVTFLQLRVAHFYLDKNAIDFPRHTNSL